MSGRLTGNLTNFVGTVIATELYTADSIVATYKKRRGEAVVAFIEEDLGDAGLDPQTIAALR